MTHQPDDNNRGTFADQPARSLPDEASAALEHGGLQKARGPGGTIDSDGHLTGDHGDPPSGTGMGTVKTPGTLGTSLAGDPNAGN